MDSGAPAGEPQGPSSCEENSVENSVVNSSSTSSRQCSSCGEPTKGHSVPFGSKCLRGLVLKLSARVDCLEEELLATKKSHSDLIDLSAKRQEGLLATINVMETELESLRSRLASKYESGDAQCTPPKSPQLSLSNASIDSLLSVAVCSSSEVLEASILDDNCRPEASASLANTSAESAESSQANECDKEANNERGKEAQETVKSSSPPSRSYASSAAQSASRTANSTGTGTIPHVDENSNAADQRELNPDDTKTGPSVNQENNNGWQTQRRRSKRRQRGHGDTILSGAAGRLADSRPSGLYGSARVSSKPLHLSHLGPDCNVADVVRYCREKRVIVTGCYFIRTRIWGTQSAKVFVDDASLEAVLSEDFWPNLVECRRWTATPPSHPRKQQEWAN